MDNPSDVSSHWGDPFGSFHYGNALRDLAVSPQQIEELSSIRETVVGVRILKRRTAESNTNWALRVNAAKRMADNSVRVAATLANAQSNTTKTHKPQVDRGNAPTTLDGFQKSTSATTKHPIFRVVVVPERQLAEARGFGTPTQPRPKVPIIIDNMLFTPFDGESQYELAERIALARLDHALKIGVSEYYAWSEFVGDGRSRAPSPHMEKRDISYYKDWMVSHQEHVQALQSMNAPAKAPTEKKAPIQAPADRDFF